MNLSLVDISGSLNTELKLDLVIDEKGRLVSCNNTTIEHIFNSNASFKLISQIIRMKAPNFLKPF